MCSGSNCGSHADRSLLNFFYFTSLGTDPHFLEKFFSHSRLSFIGSFKQRAATSSNSIHHEIAANGKGDDDDNDDEPMSIKGPTKRFVFHVDMDCFFASVVLRNFPEYRDKPVAISHNGKRKGIRNDNSHPSNNSATNDKDVLITTTSTSECATCNYHARKFGIKKGMYLGRARQLCPDLIVLQYDFQGYEEVSDQVLAILYRIASDYHGCVEPVSCDEAYLELYLPTKTIEKKSDNCDEHNDTNAVLCNSQTKTNAATTSTAEDLAGEIAERLRIEILKTTDCTATIGAASNKILAKLGTDRVKPNKSYVVRDYKTVLQTLRLRDLQGIGYRSEPKLLAEGLETVQDVWDLGSKGESVLGRILGPALGHKIFNFCQGKDDREVKPATRKTIGAECSYGVRFDGPYGMDYVMMELAKEVQRRMEGVGVKGSKLTLKIKQRKKGPSRHQR